MLTYLHIRALLAAFLILSCSPSSNAVAQDNFCKSDQKNAETHQSAMELWAKHEAAVRLLLSGEEMDFNDYFKAADFFEELTGIPCDDRHSTVGRIPGPKTEDALKAWMEWYKENSEYLYLDRDTNRMYICK